MKLSERLKEIIWLDSGNGIRRGSFVLFARHPRNNFELSVAPLTCHMTEPLRYDKDKTIEGLACLPAHIQFHIFATPYQVRDVRSDSIVLILKECQWTACSSARDGDEILSSYHEEAVAFVDALRHSRDDSSVHEYVYFASENSALRKRQGRTNFLFPVNKKLYKGTAEGLLYHFRLLTTFLVKK